MAEAAGSETDPGAKSMKKEKHTDPTTDPCASGMKKEKDADPTAGHLHRFRVKFPPDPNKYTIDCDQPGTVLRAIKTCHKYDEKFSDEKLVIQRGKEDKKYAIATHFPCTCIRQDECLILSHEKENVEETQGQNEEPIQSKEMYSVFYIETVGGKNTSNKPFMRSKAFRSKAFTDVNYLCVYGEKGREITVEEALRRDGRFIDDLDFTLSDNTDTNKITECTQPVDNLDGKEFKLCLERKKREKKEKADGEKVKQTTQGIPKTMENSPLSNKDLGDRVTAENESEGNSGQSGSSVTDIYDLLREMMMRRFPGDSYQEELNLRQEEFGKIRQSFSDIHRVRELITLGDSVCKVILESGCKGTGFVLFDNYILTNAHLFKRRGEKRIKKLPDDIKGKVTFDFEVEDNNVHYFQLAPRYICYCHDELDYAILELVCKKPNPETTEVTEVKVPPGLLKWFGPMPESGGACLIGHPGGGVKQLDPTSIIEIGNREKAVGNAFVVHKINVPKKQGIERIYVGGNKAEKGTTYNTFMYHGSSGSPVFDAQCKVFGLHISGYVYNPETSKSVIEFAQPLLTIFAHFVSKLREHGKKELLKRVQDEAKRNSDLKKILKKILNADSDDSVESD